MAGEQQTVEERRQRIEYIERMALELSKLAQSGSHVVLVYLLEMVAEEAASLRSGLAAAHSRASEAAGHRVPRTPDQFGG